MASLVLGIAGSFLGPVGAALGSLAGSILDRTVIAGWLTPKTTAEGPRVADFRLGQQEEGARANYVLGGPSRVAGVFIYAENVREVVLEEEVGGSGGGQTVRSYQYYAPLLAISFAIQKGCTIQRILAEGAVLYDENPDIGYASTLLGVESVGTVDVRMKITAPDGGPNLALFVAGKNMDVAGFSNASNNGTFEVEQAGTDTGGTFVIVRNGTCTPEAAGASVTLLQVLPKYDETKVAHVEIYDGAQSTPDPDLEAALGIGNVPAFEGAAYVVLRDLFLGPYGNRVPHFNFLCGSATGNTAAGAITTLCRRGGLSAGQIDVADVSGVNRGYALSGPVPPASGLQPLLLRHDVLTQEGNQKIRFFTRDKARVVFVPRDELAATPGLDTDRSTPWRIERGDPAQLASQIYVTYVKAENGERGGEPLVRNGQQLATVEEVYLPLAMTASEARAVGKRLSYLARLALDTHFLTLGPRWIGLQENDVVATWWTPGNLVFLQILRVDISPDFNVALECKLWHRALSTQTADADDAVDNLPGLSFGAEGDPILFEGPVYGGSAPTDVTRPTVGIAIPDDDTPFSGAQLFGSQDDEDYVTLAQITQEATAGRARTVLPGAGVDPHVFDEASTVDVEVWNGTLESVDDAAVLNGANLALIGSEIVAFRTATLIGTRLYRLSGLLRGRRDSVDAMTTHVADERFVLLTKPGLVKVDLSLAALGQLRYFKVVPAGRVLADIAARTVTITGRDLRPFAPANLFGSRDDAGNLSVSWLRRTRVPIADFPVGPVPLGEETQSYEVEFWWGSTLRRTVAAATPAATYTESQQTTDGVDHFTPVEVRVYQLSGAYGRGRALIGSV